MNRSTLLLASVLTISCAHEEANTTAQSSTPPAESQPAPAATPEPEPTPTPEAVAAAETKPAEPEVKIYAPAEIADELRFDNKKTSPAWGTTVTVKGLAVNVAVEDGDNELYYVPLANSMEHSSLDEVNCYVGTVRPEIEEGQTLVVTGTPFKPEYGNLWLKDCQIMPAPAP